MNRQLLRDLRYILTESVTRIKQVCQCGVLEELTNLFNREPESVADMNPTVALKGNVSKLRLRTKDEVTTS